MWKINHHKASRFTEYLGLSLIILFSAGAVSISGCGAVMDAPISAIEAAAEDRSAGDIGTDVKLKAGIISGINDELGAKLAALLNVDVYEQAVMLSGVVALPAEKTKAGSVAKNHSGVKKVYNEIQVVPEGTESERGVADDLVVEKKFYDKLAAASGVSHTNWRYRAVNGVLYLFGRALSKDELN